MSNDITPLLPVALLFMLVGQWSISLARARNNAWYGIALFAVTAAVLSVICFYGYAQHREFMAQRMWTAATMSVANIFYHSFPVMLLCWFARWLLWPKDDSTPSDP